MREPHSFQYSPEIDGLRTLAVIPVLLFHAGFGLPGGFAGVDVFFVISGYLIGAGILREAEAGRFGYLAFWQRRLRRLFPAWAVVMIATILLSAFTLVPPHLRDLGECLLYQPVFAANVYFWRQTGYFETASEFQPLLHTWSLAVEEQFYLFLPLVLLPLIRFGRKITLGVIVALSIVSLFVSSYFAVRYPSFGFFMLPARIWELNLGVILALLPLAKFRLERFAGMIAWIGISCIVLSYLGFDGNTPFPSYTALLPCVGAALVVLASTCGCGSARKLLAHPLPVWIGKISYPLYLWHWPVIVFVRYLWIDEPPPAVMVASLLLSTLLAWLTYRFAEVPIRTKQWLATGKALSKVAAGAAGMILLTGLLFQASKGLPGRFSAEVNQLLTPVRSRDVGLKGSLPKIMDVDHWKDASDIGRIGELTHPKAQILLWGDSHSSTLVPLLNDLGKQYRVEVFVASSAGVAPIPGTFPAGRGKEAMEIPQRVHDWVSKHPIGDVLLVSKWAMYVSGREDGELDRLLRTPTTRSTLPEQGAAVFHEHFSKLIQDLEARGSRVWVMRTVGLQPQSVPETLARIASRGKDLNSLALPLIEHQQRDAPMNALLDQATLGTGAILLDPLPYFADSQGRHLMASEGRSLYKDSDHLSPAGAARLRALFEPLFQAAVSAQ